MSPHEDTTLFEECIYYIDPALYHLLVRIPGHFCGALISKDATVHMASAHTTAQEYVGHLTRHDPFGCDQNRPVGWSSSGGVLFMARWTSYNTSLYA